MTLLGNVNIFIDCIGRALPDKKILDAVSIVAMDFEISETSYDGEKISYWEFFKIGVTFQFDESDTLKVIFIYIQNNDEYLRYPFLDDLVVGASYDSSKFEIEKLLGPSRRQGQKWIKYEMENKYLHFEFGLNDKLNLITIGESKNLNN